MSDSPTARETIRLTVDGREVDVSARSTIWDAARALGIDIPVLCHDPRLAPVGVCRLCLVDVGEKRLTAACIRKAEAGMSVETTSEKIEACRRGLVELLLSDYPVDGEARLKTGADELLELARRYGIAHDRAGGDAHPGSVPARGDRDGRRPERAPGGVGGPPVAELALGGRTRPVGGIPAGGGRPIDPSSPVIRVDHQACILCDRCIRACDDIQVNQVIGRTGKGYATRIGFDLDDPMGRSTCVACGECEKVCPTGALTLQDLFEPAAPAGPGAMRDGWEVI
ncbi:MAG: 2Fe-2S iron-sulfur cluster-binding protein [Gemmatimonadota bacterium]